MLDTNGWPEWSRYVLKSIEDLQKEVIIVQEIVTKTRIDIAQLKVKAGIWGLIGGAIPAIAAVIFLFIKQRI